MKENRNVFASPAPAFEDSLSHFHPALQSVYINWHHHQPLFRQCFDASGVCLDAADVNSLVKERVHVWGRENKYEIHFLISLNLLSALLTGITVPVHKGHGGAPHSCSTWELIADGDENSSSQITEISIRSKDNYWLSLFSGLDEHFIAKKTGLLKFSWRALDDDISNTVMSVR